MRLATFRDTGGIRLGVEQSGAIVDLMKAAALAGEAPSDDLRDMLALIRAGDDGLRRVSALLAGVPAEARLALDAMEIVAPIPRPTKNIFCLGRNYAEHAAESQRALGEKTPPPPSYPNIFTKAVTSVNGPYADIPHDADVTKELDWEVELAVIIGRGGRHIPRAEALRHVFGYTVLNDVSARDLQHLGGSQWFQGKSLDGSCPMGPWIATADEIPDPQALPLRLWVNGALKQDATTAQMIFDVATIITTLSRVLTLEPGDIIATGTPSGVGFARTPPEFLQAGDVMESEVEGIGRMRNQIVAAERTVAAGTA
ncbi:MAG TPA: fumarylacetoacetate hydrolase family protein [Ktedonobacterales bacterium]|nr:fumarylacetoacetate hydrolase family protein [Ktedonobacterales bacterium]